MTEEFLLPPALRELSQANYREKIQAASTRLYEPAARSEEVAANWRYGRWTGDIWSIAVLEAGVVHIKLSGWSDFDHYGPTKTWFFKFKNPEADFLAEVRRSHSHGLGVELGCYVLGPLEPEGPLLVQQIDYYEVWGTPHIRADPMYLPVWVEVKNREPLRIKVDEPKLQGSNVWHGWPIPVYVINN